jgi:hypothetical protein
VPSGSGIDRGRQGARARPGGRGDAGRNGGSATERPLLVGLLPTAIALLALLVLVLSVRIWILSGMLDTRQGLAKRTRALASTPVPAPPQYVSRQARPAPPPPLPGIVRAVERKTWVVIHAAPANVETFVYANGGSLLGKAPLRTSELPPGSHRLLFWAPSIGGRATQTVYVQRDATTWVNAEVRPSEHF